jgi:hypothetical protein
MVRFLSACWVNLRDARTTRRLASKRRREREKKKDTETSFEAEALGDASEAGCPKAAHVIHARGLP